MRSLVVVAVMLTALGCGKSEPPPTKPPWPSRARPVKKEPPKPTVAEAEAFVGCARAGAAQALRRARARLLGQEHLHHQRHRGPLGAADETVMEYVGRKAAEATRFDTVKLPPELRRKLDLLKLQLSLPAPKDAAKRAELARIASGMEATYGKGKYCSDKLKGSKWLKKDAKEPCLSIIEITEILAKSRNPDELLEVWQGWHTISPPMRKDFARYVELGNEGARDLGFTNLGDLWSSRYDMKPAEFEKEVDRLWEQVKPLYEDLHCYVRAQAQRQVRRQGARDRPHPGAPARQHVGAGVGQPLRPARAHQGQGHPRSRTALKQKKVDEVGMVKYGEAFFVSLGLDKLPADASGSAPCSPSPQDREVVCHASAWDVDFDADLRIKMCIKVNEEDFTTIHHELGHNYYQYYYRKLPALFRDSANDGFHEALGDTIALSVTPSYLQKLGLLDKAPDRRAQRADGPRPREDRLSALRPGHRQVALGGLLREDRAGRLQQGLVGAAQALPGRGARDASAARRSSTPGAKYHVPANVPYTRYFLAAILQFQFHRALCKLIGHTGPLHTCSIYENKEAGKRLAEMMAHGPVQALARGAQGAHRRGEDGRQRHPRLLRAAAQLAQGAEPGQDLRLVRLASNFWRVPLRTPGLPGRVNSYLVGDREIVLVDPGSDFAGELERLRGRLWELLGRGGQLRMVLLTHHHHDHVAGALRLADELGVPVAAHPATLEKLPPSRRRRWLRPLEHGARLELSPSLELELLHTPGHAAGHLCLFEPRRRVLLERRHGAGARDHARRSRRRGDERLSGLARRAGRPRARAAPARPRPAAQRGGPGHSRARLASALARRAGAGRARGETKVVRRDHGAGLRGALLHALASGLSVDALASAQARGRGARAARGSRQMERSGLRHIELTRLRCEPSFRG